MMTKSKTSRDRPMLTLGGHSYHRNNVSRSGTTYWRCTSYPRCRGTAIETRGESAKPGKPHTCQSNPELCRVKQLESEMRQKVSSNINGSVKAIYDETVAVARHEGIDHMVKPFESMANGLHKRRRLNIPTASSSALELAIPDQFRKTDDGQEFLQSDVRYLSPGGEPRRLLVFGSSRGVEMLSRASVWSYDGTFSMAPNQFQQIFVIHSKHGDVFYPSLFVFMQQRDRTSYNTLATALLDIASISDLELKPELIMSDFEQASKSVFRRSSKHGWWAVCSTTLRLCTAGLSHIIWRFSMSLRASFGSCTGR